jgi:hypothetical protein
MKVLSKNAAVSKTFALGRLVGIAGPTLMADNELRQRTAPTASGRRRLDCMHAQADPMARLAPTAVTSSSLLARMGPIATATTTDGTTAEIADGTTAEIADGTIAEIADDMMADGTTIAMTDSTTSGASTTDGLGARSQQRMRRADCMRSGGTPTGSAHRPMEGEVDESKSGVLLRVVAVGTTNIRRHKCLAGEALPVLAHCGCGRNLHSTGCLCD